MPVAIKIAVYVNSDDALVAWAPEDFIPECRGFRLERGRRSGAAERTEVVDNRVGFSKDKPQSGDHKPSNVWPFQRFNWTDHAVDVGNEVRYRVTAMVRDGAKGLTPGASSAWTPWVKLTPDVGEGFSCFFNRGLIISQFVARYLRDKKISAAKLKAQLKKSDDPAFRTFLQGDLGARLFDLLKVASKTDGDVHAALYELDDDPLEEALIKLGNKVKLVLANGSNKAGDGNAKARKNLNDHGVATIDRLLKSKGLGHNKFLVTSDGGVASVWTGSTNWSTTGLCTQINNALMIKNAKVAGAFVDHWSLLRDASPPTTKPADFTPKLMSDNDAPKAFNIGGAKVTIWFTRTSDGRDMDALRDLIASAKDSILFLMFTPGKDGLHTLAGKRANEKNMYVRGVVSTLGNTKADNDQDVLDISLVSSDQNFKPDRYSVVQPQGEDSPIGPWIGEVTRKDFLAQVGHAIVHSKILLIDPLSEMPTVVTGSHNFSKSASEKNDENLVIVQGHKRLAQAYASHVMSVYQHYRYRSYVRQTLKAGKTPWSYLDDDDQWLKVELKSKHPEISYWTR